MKLRRAGCQQFLSDAFSSVCTGRFIAFQSTEHDSHATATRYQINAFCAIEHAVGFGRSIGDSRE